MDQRVIAVIDFTHANLQRRLSSVEIANVVNLLPVRLRQLFKAEVNSSPLQYLKSLRMSRAKQLLETTYLSVKEISARVGLGHVTHFVTDFKRAYGLTPSEYRTQHRSLYRSAE